MKELIEKWQVIHLILAYNGDTKTLRNKINALPIDDSIERIKEYIISKIPEKHPLINSTIEELAEKELIGDIVNFIDKELLKWK